MKSFIPLILLCIPLISSAQDYQLQFDSYNPSYIDSWRGFEAKDAIDIRRKFVEFVESNSLLIAERQMLKMMDRTLLWSIKAVDLNNDSQTDIVYTGPNGGEGIIVYIFLQESIGFKKIQTFQQGIMKVTWRGELLDKLYVRDWGCCADPNIRNTVYQVEYHNAIPSFQLIWESIEIEEQVSKPKSLYSNPIRFIVTNEEYRLRANPYIDDTTKNYDLNRTGNTIGLLKKGFKGTCYGESKDKTGRVWWYVVIDDEFELKDSYINYEYHYPKPHLIGWISSRFVKRLDN